MLPILILIVPLPFCLLKLKYPTRPSLFSLFLKDQSPPVETLYLTLAFVMALPFTVSFSQFLPSLYLFIFTLLSNVRYPLAGIELYFSVLPTSAPYQ